MNKMVLGGAILDLNLQSKFLMFFGKVTQSILPFMWIYKFFSLVVMPYKNHKNARKLFIKEAKKLTKDAAKKLISKENAARMGGNAGIRVKKEALDSKEKQIIQNLIMVQIL